MQLRSFGQVPVAHAYVRMAPWAFVSSRDRVLSRAVEPTRARRSCALSTQTTPLIGKAVDAPSRQGATLRENKPYVIRIRHVTVIINSLIDDCRLLPQRCVSL